MNTTQSPSASLIWRVRTEQLEYGNRPRARNGLSMHNKRRAFRISSTHVRYMVILGIAILGALFAWSVIAAFPSIDNFQYRRVAESTKIYDRTGNTLLFDVHGSMRRTAVPLEAISPYIRNATIAIEDAEFYQHAGIRPLAILRALLVNLRLREGYRGQGGSTITQQVVKNTLLTQDRTLVRKAKEVVLALSLERQLDKDKILEIYLNETSYGGTIYGVEEASSYFYGKPARDVSLAEAAYLAALPQAPTRYSPYGTHVDELEERKNLVLSRMKDLGYITEDEFTGAIAEQVVFKETAESGIKAPHFVFYVREYLEEKYGADAVSNGGLQVVTTLDYDLQKKGEEIIAAGALKNEKNFNAENAGLVAIDPKTGHILTMVGSRGYFDEGIDGKVNVALTKRQPGSAFKPFVYAAAFEKGYLPETVLFDLPTQFTQACAPNDTTTHDECYAPVNYDGKFQGPLSLRSALAQSINVVAVKTLYLVGLNDALSMARRLGITTLGSRDQYGLTLVLGGGEVSLLEMTGAYATFANDGVRRPIVGVIEVKDAAGNVLEKYEEKGERVVDSQIARLIGDVLSDNVARAPSFGSDSALYFPGYQVAAKTGTTNDYRDAWILGYTTGIAAGAWAGNNDNSPMEKKVAGFIIAPLWNEFMKYAFEKYPPETFPAPAPEPDYASLPPVIRGIWNSNPSEGIHEILHWVPKNNPRTGAPIRGGDAQYANWEYPVQLWAGTVPMGTSTPIVISDFMIASPGQGEIVRSGSPVTTYVEYLDTFPIQKVTYYINNTPVGESVEAPFSITFIGDKPGAVSLKAVAEGPLGKRESIVLFSIQ